MRIISAPNCRYRRFYRGGRTSDLLAYPGDGRFGCCGCCPALLPRDRLDCPTGVGHLHSCHGIHVGAGLYSQAWRSCAGRYFLSAFF